MYEVSNFLFAFFFTHIKCFHFSFYFLGKYQKINVNSEKSLSCGISLNDVGYVFGKIERGRH